MKTVELLDYFLWNGEIVRCDWINPGEKAIGFRLKRTVTCPHCNKEHDIEDQAEIIESSQLFQENAQPIKTIKE